MDKKNMNIESYDEQDAFYAGSDEEYEEFLRNADIKLNDGERAESVANTQRINLNETINIQSVIDKFKKTAGGIENSARKFKDTVVNTMDMFKTKNEDAAEDDEQSAQKNRDGGIELKSESEVPEAKENDNKVNVENTFGANTDISFVKEEIGKVSADISTLSEKIENLEDRVKNAELKNREWSIEQQSFYDDLRRTMNDVVSGMAEVKQAVGSVSKVNDSIFDLKNTQHNTKNALVNLETAISRLKKKCVLGVTVLSILSAIVIALEILLMLS